jgi:drug/metabolite transporter (DMT)-like permease
MSAKLKGYKTNKSLVLGHLGALLTIAIWGVSFVSTRVLLDNGMHPVEIYVYRFVLAYLLVLVMSHSRLFANSWRDELLFLSLGLCGGSFYFIAENTALQYTLVSNVSLLTSLPPLITTLLVGVLYKSERPGSGMILGSVIAFLGVACVIFNSSFNLQINPLGDLLSIAASFGWAVYSLILRKLNALYDIWFITRKAFFYGVVTSLPFLYFESGSMCNPLDLVTNSAVIGNLLFLGVGASMVAYLLWAKCVKQMGAIKANNYMYFQPIFTMIFSAIILGEHVSLVGYIGCATILFGLWLGDYLSRKQAAKQGA